MKDLIALLNTVFTSLLVTIAAVKITIETRIVKANI